MRIAWFRPAPMSAVDARIATAFETELSRQHVVHAFDEKTAHDFVWKHFRAPYDVCLYELRSSPSGRFVRAYVPHYPGVLLAHDLVEARDSLIASRLVVVNSASTADLLAGDVDRDRIRVAPQFAAEFDAPAAPAGDVVRFGVLDDRHRELVARAISRARTAGAAATLVEADDDVDRIIRESDVVIALQGPLFMGPLMVPLLGMSAVRPVIVSDAEVTAEWPALDPQTWLPRGYFGNDSPAVVSIDPRDEEHSLMLAIRRLSSDRALRARLGAGGRRWWEAHATPAHAAEQWQHILEQARSTLPSQSAGTPPDGTSFARDVLADFDVPVDLFDS